MRPHTPRPAVERQHEAPTGDDARRSPAELLADARAVYEKTGPTGLAYAATRFALPTPLDCYLDLAKRELERGVPGSLSPTERLAVYRRGFTTRLYHLYGFDEGKDPDDYLSEVTRKAYADRLNDDPGLVDDKERFHEAFEARGLGEFLPEFYGRIVGGEFEGAAADVVGLLRREGALVVKDARGGGGSGVSIYALRDGTIRRDGTALTPAEARAEVAARERALVTEYCRQAAYLDDLYPGSPNTVRVLAIDPTDAEAFVPAAAQRIGTDRTGGLDNFTQGGLSAAVDVETGELGPGVAYRGDAGRSEDVVRTHETHPDTGARIDGVRIPGWETIRDALLDVTASLPELRYVGWDVLVTGPGEFVLVEGNSYPDPDVLQVHRPLLADARVRGFLRGNGVPVDG